MTSPHTEPVNAVQDEAEEAEPTLLEQMGGLTGLVSATLPIVVLIPVNNFWGLGPALAAALGMAALIFVWRLARRDTLQPAISGLLGVAICAGIAWYTGSAKGYFLYGIWMSLLFFIVAFISILVRWPIVGVVWKGINGEDMSWRELVPARRAYAVATAGWAVVFLARFVIQRAIYDADATTALGIVRIVMGWPLTGLVTLLTVWMVRRANAAMRDEKEERQDKDSAENTESAEREEVASDD
ncbi:DUF3159 domain-containing protein [Corynebacterium sp.]|uniref:DUF3159 domain-containing protein n=1 Tax=Corynebacterium sp. TaxID=1720 RepID=UPI0026DAB712|nr:DUF3159 domain-containing protein [Corynebacterium sp.]MDO5031721.1 DUF3159 domain-containing protein [Corynebacterium sp.]